MSQGDDDLTAHKFVAASGGIDLMVLFGLDENSPLCVHQSARRPQVQQGSGDRALWSTTIVGAPRPPGQFLHRA